MPTPDELEKAILGAVAYSDVFLYPLRVSQVHRYLPFCKASLQEVQEALQASRLFPQTLECRDGSYTLARRQAYFETQRTRAAWSAELWPRAEKYARLLHQFPFVRMVAVTGALAMDNEAGFDLDYLIVTAPGRLWLCRGLVMLLVRWAALAGDALCPNYFISENSLSLSDQNLYTAHEIAQMVPLSGLDIYWEMRRLNPWVEEFLPNAVGLPRQDILAPLPAQDSLLKKSAESFLSLPLGAWVERWELHRKQRKFKRIYPHSSEAEFSPQLCKGHFGEYGKKSLKAYQQRLEEFGAT